MDEHLGIFDDQPDRAAAASITIDCPRCGREATVRFYGPCDSCRDELRAAYAGLGRDVEAAEYVPKMNVTPNAVATKDD